MPHINLKTTTAITPSMETELKTKLGKAIECFLGKTEAWLMISFEDNCRIWFKGDNSQNSAMIEIQLLGHASNREYDNMTEVVCDIVNSVLNIPKDRIYVKYEECEHWGWNGSNF